MLDMTLAEFEQSIKVGEVIEEVALGEAQTKELTLVVEWPSLARRHRRGRW
jgi:hypothetical protein